VPTVRSAQKSCPSSVMSAAGVLVRHRTNLDGDHFSRSPDRW
jgi:hypothetical protein